MVEPKITRTKIFGIIGARTSHRDQVLNGFFLAIACRESHLEVRKDDVLGVFDMELASVDRDVATATIHSLVGLHVHSALQFDGAVHIKNNPVRLAALKSCTQRTAA